MERMEDDLNTLNSILQRFKNINTGRSWIRDTPVIDYHGDHGYNYIGSEDYHWDYQQQSELGKDKQRYTGNQNYNWVIIQR